jgi:hypothetical protein
MLPAIPPCAALPTPVPSATPSPCACAGGPRWSHPPPPPPPLPRARARAEPSAGGLRRSYEYPSSSSPRPQSCADGLCPPPPPPRESSSRGGLRSYGPSPRPPRRPRAARSTTPSVRGGFILPRAREGEPPASPPPSPPIKLKQAVGTPSRADRCFSCQLSRHKQRHGPPPPPPLRSCQTRPPHERGYTGAGAGAVLCATPSTKSCERRSGGG